MKTLIVVATLGLTALTAAPALAQVDARENRQAGRIEQGVQSGELTRGEARGLEHNQRSIAREEARMRARHGGSLGPGQRAALQARQDRASARIYAAKHNGSVQ